MRVILFGATGMVGQGALLACLRDPAVTDVLAVGRTPTGRSDPKLRDLVVPDLFRLDDRAADLARYDACFFCLGVSSSGMSETGYSRITHDLTMRVARTLSQLNRGMTFIYVSGAGTDGSGKGRSMWARVKGRTENDLRLVPFKAAYAFRPGIIQPLDGIRSKTRSYRLTYAMIGPFLPPLRWLIPSVVLTTDGIGRAMIAAARRGAPKSVLEAADINRLIR